MLCLTLGITMQMSANMTQDKCSKRQTSIKHNKTCTQGWTKCKIPWNIVTKILVYKLSESFGRKAQKYQCIKIAEISVQKQSFPGMRFPNSTYFHEYTRHNHDNSCKHFSGICPDIMVVLKVRQRQIIWLLFIWSSLDSWM